MTVETKEWEAKKSESPFAQALKTKLAAFKKEHIDVDTQVNILTDIIENSNKIEEAKKNLKLNLSRCENLPTPEVLKEMLKWFSTALLVPSNNHKLKDFNEVETIQDINNLIDSFQHDTQKNNIFSLILKLNKEDVHTLYEQSKDWDFSKVEYENLFINGARDALEEKEKEEKIN